MSPSAPLLKVADVQTRLGLGPTATRGLIAAGAIPSLRVGPGARSIRVRAEDLEQWIASRVESGSNEESGAGDQPDPLRGGGHLRVHRSAAG
jgi:excisionase family DNA binding protein